MSTCKQCGSCCHLIIDDISAADAIREPRIAKEGRRVNTHWDGTENEDIRYSLNIRNRLNDWDGLFVCVFLRGKMCSIYETRPDVCRYFEPGGKQCVYSRNSRRREGMLKED